MTIYKLDYNNQEWIFFEYSAIYSIYIPNFY